MSQALCFNDVQFDVIPQNSQPWVRGYQIGTALGYGENADVSIRKLYNRHADEFTDAMTAVITLPTEGGPQGTRIFSLRGCHLLAMFARTPVAKKFRRWVLDVLDKLAMEERARAATDDKALPEVAITPEQQAQLKAIADAKIGMIAPELQRKAYGELWSRFTRHFRIARYAQLPSPKMGEAVEYLVGLEIKAIKTLPPAPEQKALPEPHKDKFAAYLAEVEAFRAKTEQEMDRLIYDGMKLVNYFKVGPVIHSACLRLLSDWLRKTVVSVRSLPELEATSGGGGLIGLLRELDTRISMDQSIRAWANEI